MIKELFGQYYGLDWIAMVTSVISIYLIGSKHKYGFFFGIASAIAWTYTNFIAHIWAGIILNIILIVLYIRGYIKWKE